MLLLNALAWGLAAVLAVAAAWLSARRPGWLARALLWLAAAVLLSGLGWQAWVRGDWPGHDPASALALLGCGAALCAGWLVAKSASAAQRALRPALWLTALAAAVAAALAWLAPMIGTAVAVPARTWLFGLRSLLTGLGLGGWLVAAAGLAWQAGHAVAAARGGQVSRRDAWAQGATNAQQLMVAGVRFGLLWLTAGLLATAAWDLFTTAAPWQGTPGEIWPVVAWLLGVAYVQPAWASGSALRRRVLPALLVLAGAAAACLAVAQASLILR